MLHVAVAIIKNPKQEVLVARRSPKSPQGDLWEFPGGKVESDETVFSALQREIFEEVGLRIQEAYPFIKIHHDYVDNQVLLDVWQVTMFEGEAYGREGQKVQWLASEVLRNFKFPKANHRIIDLLQLPTQMAITPQFECCEQLSTHLKLLKSKDLRAVQIRQKQLTPDQSLDWTRNSLEVLGDCKLRLILNGPIRLEEDLPSGVGLHLTSAELGRLQESVGGRFRVVGCTCHSKQDLAKAELLGFDYALLSPMVMTSEYSDSKPLDWGRFKELAGSVSLPVYALGGTRLDDVSSVFGHGAAGVASVGAY